MWIWLLGIALFSLLVAVAALMQAKRSASEAQANEERLNQRVEVLEKELSAMMDGAFGVASQLQKVESNLRSTVQQQEQLQQRDMGNLPYNEAVRRVSQGADVDELVEHCGLSRSEAELVEMLHKKSSVPVVDEPEIAVPVDMPEPTSADEIDLQHDGSPENRSVFNDTIEESIEPEPSEPEGDEPLFSGDLGGEDFQEALERARESQTQSTASSEGDAKVQNDSGKQSNEPDER